MTTRDIAGALQEMYGAEVSLSRIAKVTDAIQDEVQKWQSRPRENLYPILYLDGIVVKVHQDKRGIKKTAYVALGVNTEGHKEILGLWLSGEIKSVHQSLLCPQNLNLNDNVRIFLNLGQYHDLTYLSC